MSSGCLQGMGGQHGYFGLWLDSEFGHGHSRARPKCTTYGSPQLSAEEEFTLDSLEVWAVGKPPEPEEVRGHRKENYNQLLKQKPGLVVDIVKTYIKLTISSCPVDRLFLSV